jgi:hypothetical protein
MSDDHCIVLVLADAWTSMLASSLRSLLFALIENKVFCLLDERLDKRVLYQSESLVNPLTRVVYAWSKERFATGFWEKMIIAITINTSHARITRLNFLNELLKNLEDAMREMIMRDYKREICFYQQHMIKLIKISCIARERYIHL